MNYSVGDYIHIPSLKKSGVLVSIEGKGKTRRLYVDDVISLTRQILPVPEDTEVVKKSVSAKLKQVIREYQSHQVRQTSWIGGTIGSDPEMFVVDSKTQQVVPAFDFLPPQKKGETPYDQPFWDGFQAEWNTPGSLTCLQQVQGHIRQGLANLLRAARSENKNAELTITPTVDIPIDMLQKAKPEHVAFGCSPSINVYNMSGEKRDGRMTSFRSAGGHIHMGIAGMLSSDKTRIERYVKALDKILGVACVSLFANFDDPRRRTMYGLAGEYRLPKHGLEYRTLSNVWLAHPLLFMMVYELARKTIGMAEVKMMEAWDATEEETINCINECDVEKAREILMRNRDVFTALLSSINSREADNMFKIYYLGLESIIKDPTDILGNWSIDTKTFAFNNMVGYEIRYMNALPLYKELSEKEV